MTQSFLTSSPGSHSHRSNLPRGKACMNCRRRKIKCDGKKPVCGQCIRSPGTAEDCEYPLEGRSRTQQLEETIKKLQSRIGELETTVNDGQSSIFLHEPYDGGDPSFMAVEIPQFTESWSPSGATSPSSRVNTPTSASSSSSLILEEPPRDVIERLVDAFLGNFSQVGFFLDSSAFRHSALLPFPFGHHERPSPALLSAVYMWGCRLSRASDHPVYNEDAFLVCTLQNIHQDLGGRHPHRVVHSIQAEILLSFYYLNLGRPVEGIYHSSAAVSLAISGGLHLIRSSQLPPPPCFGVLETPFPPATDSLEEGQRINAFWTVVILNNYWVAAHGSPSAIPYHDTPIDTPWPLDLEDYVSPVSAFPLYSTPNAPPMPDYQQLFEIVGGGSTVSNFLGGLNIDGFSPLAMLSKASILLERAITFSTRYSDHSDVGAFDSLDALLEQFLLGLPIGIELGGDEVPKRSLVVTQTLTQAAIIRLHAHRIHTSDVSRNKHLSAAKAVVHIINDTDLSQWRHIDPIMGILWTTACEVFVAELARIQSFGVLGRLTRQHEELSACLDTVLSSMKAFSGTSPVIEYFAARVERAYEAVSRPV
ncbi:Zn(2)-Cys(6) binuclear cluster domain-containing protein [Mycena maculata]|uniref:Zn(2)-Cys(6) binuclear cluster domain-containing protein n=1 Tax=Mycena maculata TaxID=230809 RepID=A0AAD7MTC2_9AGAR|nr:Zn(2)-Cys(6) binuclear cluster domain-containing protein [Mycena maculata]